MLVVPPTFDGWGFIVDFYNPAFCNGVSEDMYKSAIRQVNKIVMGAKCKNRQIESRNLTGLHNILFIFGLVVLVIGFVSIEAAVLRGTKSMMLYYVGGVCFVLVSLLSIGLFISIFVFKQETEVTETDIFN